MQDKLVVLAALARALARQPLDAPLAHRLGAAACAVVGAEGAAITLSYTLEDRITICATTDLAARVEDLQEVLGQGPGSMAYETGAQVQVVLGRILSNAEGNGREVSSGPGEPSGQEARTDPAQTSRGRRWPELSQQVASDFGSIQVLAVPIRPDHEILGVLTFYGSHDARRDLDGDAAQFLADAIGVALLHESQWQVNETSGPWASRSHVHQATGMVIAQLQIPPHDALALLRAHAFAHSASLLEICDAVLRHEIDFASTLASDGAGSVAEDRNTGAEDRTTGAEDRTTGAAGPPGSLHPEDSGHVGTGDDPDGSSTP